MNQKPIFLSLVLLTACASAPPKSDSLENPEKNIKAQEQRGERIPLAPLPAIVATARGMTYLGGFSGLHYLGKEGDKWQFLTHTDRGPNGETFPYGEKGQEARVFLFSKFQPRLVLFSVDSKTKKVQIQHEILLKNSRGEALSGLPNKSTDEIPVNLEKNRLPLDPEGMDLEGVALDSSGNFWMGEEYGPSLAQFSPQGKLLRRFLPGKGLPESFSARASNRGFEAIAIWGYKLYAFLQSPLPIAFDPKKKSRNIRILEFDLKTKRTTAQYLYRTECDACDKIGDASFTDQGELLVIERDGLKGEKSFKKVFRIDLKDASNLEKLSLRLKGKDGLLEAMNEQELAFRHIKPVKKTEVADLAKAGFVWEKAEGLSLVEGTFLAVVNDNDFAVFPSEDNSSNLFLVPFKN